MPHTFSLNFVLILTLVSHIPLYSYNISSVKGESFLDKAVLSFFIKQAIVTTSDNSVNSLI